MRRLQKSNCEEFKISDFKFQIGTHAMTQDEMKARTKAFALRVVKLVRALPKTIEGRAFANQLIRSGTSVASNYRAACRGRSRAEFAAKTGTVLEEADESLLWLELIVEAGLLTRTRCRLLLEEATELVAIFAATRKSSLAKPI
jgi:four helix bundle protein